MALNRVDLLRFAEFCLTVFKLVDLAEDDLAEVDLVEVDLAEVDLEDLEDVLVEAELLLDSEFVELSKSK